MCFPSVTWSSVRSSTCTGASDGGSVSTSSKPKEALLMKSKTRFGPWAAFFVCIITDFIRAFWLNCEQDDYIWVRYIDHKSSQLLTKMLRRSCSSASLVRNASETLRLLDDSMDLIEWSEVSFKQLTWERSRCSKREICYWHGYQRWKPCGMTSSTSLDAYPPDVEEIDMFWVFARCVETVR